MFSCRSYSWYNLHIVDSCSNADIYQAASKIFGLPHAVLACSESTTLDEFGNAILIEGPNPAYTAPRPSSRGTQEVFLAVNASAIFF